MSIEKLAWQGVNEILSKNKMLTRNVMLYGGQFLNPRQQRVASRFLLQNDEFVRAAEELAQKTKNIVAIVPNSKQHPGVQIRIFKAPQTPFESHFVTDKKGGMLFGFIDDRYYGDTNKYNVKDFIALIRKYIKKEV